MSTVTSKRLDQRPYTVGTFQKRLNDFEDFIKEITLQDVEATPEERRQMIAGKLWLRGVQILYIMVVYVIGLYLIYLILC